jgi:hypothetical protein
MEAIDLTGQLCEAIRQRWLVMFEYGDLIRVVEPHRVGVNSAGHRMLSGWLRDGYGRSDPAGGWRNYLLSEVRGLQLLAAPFAAPRPGFAAHDARMREVFCELEVADSASEAPADSPFVVSDSTSGTAPVEQASRTEPASGSRRPEESDPHLGEQGEQRRA